MALREQIYHPETPHEFYELTMPAPVVHVARAGERWNVLLVLPDYGTATISEALALTAAKTLATRILRAFARELPCGASAVRLATQLATWKAVPRPRVRQCDDSPQSPPPHARCAEGAVVPAHQHCCPDCYTEYGCYLLACAGNVLRRCSHCWREEHRNHT